MWSPVEAYPILADRELKSLTDNPLFNTAMYSLLVSPVHRPPLLESLRGSSQEATRVVASIPLPLVATITPFSPEAKALCTYDFTIRPTAHSLYSNYCCALS